MGLYFWCKNDCWRDCVKFHFVNKVIVDDRIYILVTFLDVGIVAYDKKGDFRMSYGMSHTPYIWFWGLIDSLVSYSKVSV